MAHIVWLLEVLNNKSHQFSRQYVTGISTALWWSIITTSTVGYGDFVPATALGKLTAVIGLFVGIVITVGGKQLSPQILLVQYAFRLMKHLHSLQGSYDWYCGE